MTIKGQIYSLATGGKAGRTPVGPVPNPDRKNNGPYLFDIYYWQELSDLADKELKKAWKAATEAEVLEEDDTYRQVLGETIAAESSSFSCVMKVSAPKKTIDKEAFLAAVSRKSRLAVSTLEALWEDHQKEGKAALSKRVLEV